MSLWYGPMRTLHVILAASLATFANREGHGGRILSLGQVARPRRGSLEERSQAACSQGPFSVRDKRKHVVTTCFNDSG